jgi:hypothetical protein
MPALCLRGIPEDVYDALKAMTAGNPRSRQEQARLLLEREVRLHPPAAMERSGAGANACGNGPCPTFWRICAPTVTVEMPAPIADHVLDASAFLRLFLAAAPLHEGLEAPMGAAPS